MSGIWLIFSPVNLDSIVYVDILFASGSTFYLPIGSRSLWTALNRSPWPLACDCLWEALEGMGGRRHWRQGICSPDLSDGCRSAVTCLRPSPQLPPAVQVPETAHYSCSSEPYSALLQVQRCFRVSFNPAPGSVNSLCVLCLISLLGGDKCSSCRFCQAAWNVIPWNAQEKLSIPPAHTLSRNEHLTNQEFIWVFENVFDFRDDSL